MTYAVLIFWYSLSLHGWLGVPGKISIWAAVESINLPKCGNSHLQESENWHRSELFGKKNQKIKKSKFNWHMKMEQSVSEVLLLILEVMMVVCLIFGHDPSMTCSYRSLWQAQITQWLLSQKWTLSWPVTTDISVIGRLFMGLWIDSSVQNHWHMLNHLAIMSRASELLLGNDGR